MSLIIIINFIFFIMIFFERRVKLFECTGGEHNTIFFYFFSYLFSYLKIIINIIKNIIKKNNEIFIP